MRNRNYDPDEEGAAETWAEDEYRRRRDEALDPPVGVGPPPGYGTENHPGRKADRESIHARITRINDDIAKVRNPNPEPSIDNSSEAVAARRNMFKGLGWSR